MTLKNTYHVTAIGNALVDFLCSVEDDFIKKMGLTKGGFSLIELEQAQNLYQNMGPSTEMSGGSAANTIAALAEMGAKTGFIGAVGEDQIGTIFQHDIQSLGVNFKPIIHTNIDNSETGRCYILVSPDAQRTMSTYLGVAGLIAESELDLDIIKNSDFLYVEGYMWVIDETKKAILKAVEVAHSAGNKAALTLSDVFCVNSFRKEFLDIIHTKFDLIFANEDEVMALFEVKTLDAAIEEARKTGKIFAITCGANGSVIIDGDQMVKVNAVTPKQLIDTTGAGDSFAAGFLYGQVFGYDYQKSAEIGSKIAAKIISEIGARAQEDLKSVI